MDGCQNIPVFKRKTEFFKKDPRAMRRLTVRLNASQEKTKDEILTTTGVKGTVLTISGNEKINQLTLSSHRKLA
jgi:hypothetical protein